MPTRERIQAAIATIQEEGGSVSIESVRAITGGSPRDIAPMLKQTRGETAPKPAPAGYVMQHPDPPTRTRLTWADVSQAAQAIRRETQQSLWTQSRAEPLLDLIVGYFYRQHRFSPPIHHWEVWSALRDAVTDRDEARLLEMYVGVLQRGQLLFSEAREARQLRELWARLMGQTP